MSGEEATPASPIAPARESGVIDKNGTPVRMVLAPVVELVACEKDYCVSKVSPIKAAKIASRLFIFIFSKN
jgi:hypothetical protein